MCDKCPDNVFALPPKAVCSPCFAIKTPTVDQAPYLCFWGSIVIFYKRLVPMRRRQMHYNGRADIRQAQTSVNYSRLLPDIEHQRYNGPETETQVFI